MNPDLHQPKPLTDGRQLVLASASLYRQRLLEKLGLAFTVQAPDVDESRLPEELGEQLAHRLACLKARTIATSVDRALVVGSDQVAVLDDEILGKPGSYASAIAQLRKAAGKAVTFHTGLCLIDSASGREQHAVIDYRVWFRQLTHTEIKHYVKRETPYDSAGSFKAEGLGIALFERLQGDDPNALIGLPLIRLVTMLRREGINVL